MYFLQLQSQSQPPTQAEQPNQPQNQTQPPAKTEPQNKDFVKVLKIMNLMMNDSENILAGFLNSHLPGEIQLNLFVM
jgi:hypothetical protein